MIKGADDELDIKIRKLLSDFDITPLAALPPIDENLFKLGKRLFEDKLLSGNKNISCQTCHHINFGTSDGLPLSIGEGGMGIGNQREQNMGAIIPRNSPHLWNLGYSGINRMFWDGRVEFFPREKRYQTPEPALNSSTPNAKEIVDQLTGALSAQALFPLTAPDEMRGQKGSNELADASSNLEVWARIMERILTSSKKIDEVTYLEMFLKTFPKTDLGDFNIGHVGRAIAGFVSKEFNVVDTPFDQYLNGNNNALTLQEKKGLEIFLTKGMCVLCHQGPQLTDFDFKSVGTPQISFLNEQNFLDFGRFSVTGNSYDKFKFKTPSLRNIILSPPYMHDGVFQNLEQVIDHYNNPSESLSNYIIPNDFLNFYPNGPLLLDQDRERNDLRISLIETPSVRQGVNLNEQEKAELLYFLRNSLTSCKLLKKKD